ncbi:LysM peptidoglycan-binding domain-containing protein [Candidatus Saccharibacteria bacterium]|nr:LysM peptidoglycan-binding domain-containing protein [Candidatus Saccharibacteria bacterium]
MGVLFVLVALVMSGYEPPSVNAEDHSTKVATIDQSAASANTAVAPLATIDDIKSANLAANVASSANLSVANSVYNQSISMSTSADLGQFDATTIGRAQITDLTTAMNVLTAYTVVEGDTASSIADKFGVSAQTIRWANNLKGDSIAVGSTVVVPVVDGVVYVVKAGDNLNTIAAKYKSNIDDIVMVNDLDDLAVAADTKILLPQGILPENERPGYQPPISDTGGGTTMYVPVANGNRYSYGYCTWYAYNRRLQLGRPIPSNLGNANTWDDRARAAGYRVDHIPEAGAVFQTDSGALGHVGIVEHINPDGSIFVSEMNNHAYGGWGKVSTRTIYNPGDYNYIH